MLCVTNKDALTLVVLRLPATTTTVWERRVVEFTWSASFMDRAVT